MQKNDAKSPLPTTGMPEQLKQHIIKAEIPAMWIPSYRHQIAEQNNADKNILMICCGGLGDQVCAESTIRYACDNFPQYGYSVSLLAMNPTLFSHLKFKDVYDLSKNERPNFTNYWPFSTIAGDQDFGWQFMCHLFCHCVDYASLISFRMQLPMKYKELRFRPSEKDFSKINKIIEKETKGRPYVIRHSGLTWQSKAAPIPWENELTEQLDKKGILSVFIGQHMILGNEIRTTQDVNMEGQVDLRNKLSLIETIALIKQSKVIFTNDSAPLHMAADSDAWIGFFTMAKYPEYITHYRRGEFGWRMKNFAKSSIWEKHCILEIGLDVKDIGDLLEEWMPSTEEVAKWIEEKLY